MNRSISPPPLRRRRHGQQLGGGSPATTINTSARAGTLRIFAWNVNGIAPFVAPYLQFRPQQQQQSIRSFFDTAPRNIAPGKNKKRKRGTTGNGDVSADPGDEMSGGQLKAGFGTNGEDEGDGTPSLRCMLKRHAWPHILLLQEVKIKHGDTPTMGAVRAAVNDTSTISLTCSIDSRSLPASYGQPRQIQTAEKKMGKEEERGVLHDGGPVYDVHFNLPCDAHNAKGFGGKLYGVAAVIRRDFARAYIDTIRDVPWDNEGRVQVIETKGLTFPLGVFDSSLTRPSTPQLVPPDTVAAKSTPQSQSDTNHKLTPAMSMVKSKKEVKLAIINIYAVNGTSNAYRSSDTGAVVGTRHDRKLAVHYELLREAKWLEDRGYAVVIGGDLNVALDSRDGHPNLRTWPREHVLNRADFNDKFFSEGAVSVGPGAERALYARGGETTDEGGSAQRGEAVRHSEGVKLTGLNGIDTFRSVHGGEQRYSYYPRGRSWGTSCDRVDLIIASKALGGLLVDTGICDNPQDRGPSDHCPIWAEFGQVLE
jgi:exonuclease III